MKLGNSLAGGSALPRWFDAVLWCAFLVIMSWANVGPSPAQAAEIAVAPEIQAVLDSIDRSPADRETDRRRRPGETLHFLRREVGHGGARHRHRARLHR